MDINQSFALFKGRLSRSWNNPWYWTEYSEVDTDGKWITPIMQSKTYKLRNHLQRKYGMTEMLFNSILGNQLGLCAICCKTNGERRLNVDHDHNTNEIRGLLCDRCNFRVGVFETQSIEEIEAIKTYLEIT